jgi:hypothetical protein
MRNLQRLVPVARLSLAMAIIALFLLACGGGPTPTPIIVVVTNTAAPEPAVVVVTATFTPEPEVLPAETPASPPSPTPVPPSPVPDTVTSPTAESVAAPAWDGQFGLVTPDQGLPEVEVNDLWVAPDGALWAATASGVFRHAGGAWSQLMAEPASRIQGADAQGLVWVILAGETAIAAYDPAGTWSRYGPEQGWSPVPAAEYLSPGYGDGLVTDEQGMVWLATGRDDLRRFNPVLQMWSVYPATQFGFNPPAEEGYQGHFLTDVARAGDGALLVADCMGQGESYMGQGLHRVGGAGWSPEPPTAEDCVQDIEVDTAGRIYAGGFDALLTYDPAAASWSRIELPPWDRRQLVIDITLDGKGNPWVQFIRYGGASAWGSVARYHLQHGSWVQDHEGWTSDLAFSSDGAPWLCSEGSVYRLDSGAPELAGTVGGYDCRIAVDGGNRVWVASDTGLWKLDP